ncbi:hypothetical protein [Bacillus sp. SD088]|uniref:hypothetical protein n=1 Tax=Bacillus sp. SD088 TaxID=2782012 RepID=UPI001A96ABB5|nr:hypothetical protein [Bacillus sp. SD088]MBO0995611.1 hypothetical protein [Bacillus sp. SD088]
MKQILLTMIILLFTGTLLIACSDDGNKTDGEEQDIENNAEEDNKSDEEEVNSDSSSDSNSDNSEVTEADQTDLKIGDTAVVQTSIGTYELTVDSAEIVGSELDGEASLLDELIVLDLTFKNTSDDTLVAEDLMYNLGITTSLEGSNTSNNAEHFESIQVFEGEIAPGEEKQAQFIADVKTSDEYYFRPNPGVVTNGTHNDFLWMIEDEEARK